MLRANGLYGHMQRNNAKAAVLIVTLLGLFLIVQFSVRTVYFLQMAQAEANGLVLPPVRDSDPLVTRLFGIQVEQREQFQHRLAVLRGEEAATEADREANQKLPAPTGPHRNATLIDAFRVMFARTQYLGLQCVVLLLLALVFIGNSARRTGLLMRYATRARPLERREYPELYNLVENIALTAGLPCPAIELIESDKLNAYATGLTPASARLGLTTGLIDTLDRRELEAVIAHEITHILNGDTKLMAVTKACADLVVEQPRRMWQALSGMRRPRYVPLFLFIPFLILFVLPPILVTLVLSPKVYAIMLGLPAVMAVGGLVCKAMMHHSREFVADAGAIELTKNSAALVSALRKMAGLDAQLTTNLTAQAMMFSGSDGGWLSTHPKLTARIEAITLHGGMLPGEVHVTQPRVAVAPPRPGQAPTFGRRGQPRALAGRHDCHGRWRSEVSSTNRRRTPSGTTSYHHPRAVATRGAVVRHSRPSGSRFRWRDGRTTSRSAHCFTCRLSLRPRCYSQLWRDSCLRSASIRACPLTITWTKCSPLSARSATLAIGTLQTLNIRQLSVYSRRDATLHPFSQHNPA